jgi:ABC-type Fe3+-citrate transport system substrate-binding protein
MALIHKVVASNLSFNKDKYDRLKAGKSIGEGVDEAKDYNAEIQRHKDIAAKQRKKMSKATSHADMVAAMNRHMKAKKNQRSLTHAQAHMEEVKLDEKLKPSMGAGEYVKDFQDSDAPQFKGKSKEKRQKMAIAAYLAAKRGDK